MIAQTNPSPETQPEQPTPRPIEKWAALEGRWHFAPGEGYYLGPSKPESTIPFGLALGSIPFRDGSIRTSVRLARNECTSAGIAIGYQSMNAEWVSAQIGAHDRAYAISVYRPGVGWEAIALAGLLSNVNLDQDHIMELTVAGQRVSMTVDDVRVFDLVLPKPLEGTGAGLFAWDDAKVVFTRTEVTTVRPRIFVIMPFAEPFDTLYREVIRPVAERLEFEIVRVDELEGPGIIVDDIQRQISQANAVVAEISSRNPNVFYELGYAHALEKPAVLLAKRESSGEMPFDIRGYRAIFYDDTIGGKKAVERSLEQHLRAVLGNANTRGQLTI
ncbi:MAG: hypothetical protein ACREXK_05375 [Gammaproteobacteria bacterium]